MSEYKQQIMILTTYISISLIKMMRENIMHLNLII